MENPWHQLPDKPPFVLKEDRPAIDGYMKRARPEHRPHVGLVPEPFGGNLDAPVLLLDSHPGVCEEDYEAHKDAAFAAATRASLRLEPAPWPVHPLDPRYRWTPAGQYSLRLFATLADAVQARSGGDREDAWRRIASGIGYLHFFPYHREKSNPSQRVPSQGFSFDLVRRAMKRDALLVLRNCVTPWSGNVGGLASYKRRCEANSPLATAISPGNLPGPWFDRVADAIAAVEPAPGSHAGAHAKTRPPSPGNYVGRRALEERQAPRWKRVQSDATGTVLLAEIAPGNMDEIEEFFQSGANGYELQLHCDPAGVIDDFRLQVDPCPCSPVNFAPRGVPAWIFGPDARFTVAWDDLAESAQTEMLLLLHELTTPAGPPCIATRVLMSRPRKA